MPARVTLNYGTSGQIKASIVPAYATNKELIWTCSDETIAGIVRSDDNQSVTIYPHYAGTVTITAMATDGSGVTARSTVIINPKNIAKVSAVTADKTELNIKKGNTQSITATLSPARLTDDTTFRVKIPEGMEGCIQATEPVLKIGTTNTYEFELKAIGESSEAFDVILEAVTDDGTVTGVVKQTFVHVNVRSAITKAERIEFDRTGATLKALASLGAQVSEASKTSFVTTVYPEDTTDKSIVYSIVDENNVVTDIAQAVNTAKGVEVKAGYVNTDTTVYLVATAQDGSGVTSRIPILLEKATVIDEDTGLIATNAFKPDEVTGEIKTNLWIAGLNESYVYNGKRLGNVSDIRVYDGTTKLTINKDYRIVFANDVAACDGSTYDNTIAARRPRLTVTFIGNYGGSLTEYFKITQKPLGNGTNSAEGITSTPITIAVRGANVLQKPVPTVKNGTTGLVNNRDFTVTYTKDGEAVTGVTAAGEYKAVVTGKGNYTGSFEVPITVVDTKQDVIITSAAVTLKNRGAFVYSEGGYSAEDILDSIKYSRKDVTGEAYSLSIAEAGADGKVKEVGTYNLIITGTGVADVGSGKCFKGTRTVTFKITGTPLANVAKNKTEFAATLYYDRGVASTATGIRQSGEAEGLVAKNATSGLTFTKDIDYTVEYLNNTKTGTATVVYTGKGKYTGVIRRTFRIVPDKTDTVLSIDPIPDTVYEKGGVKPYVTVKATKDGNTYVLKENVDYRVTYSYNTMVAAADSGTRAPLVTVTGIGDYAGLKTTRNYSIIAKDIGSLNMSASDVAYVKRINSYKNTRLVITDTNGKALQAGVDYDNKNITYIAESNMPSTGAVITVRVNGKGNYSGTISASYKIFDSKKNIASTSCSFIYPNSQKGFTYSGSTIEPTGEQMIIKPGRDTILTEGVDFKIISYSNNVVKGTGRVTVQGIGEYGGTKTFTFVILTKNAKN